MSLHKIYLMVLNIIILGLKKEKIMQKKFIDITKKHLASKFILVIFVTMYFISCSHIADMAYNGGYMSSQDSDFPSSKKS